MKRFLSLVVVFALLLAGQSAGLSAPSEEEVSLFPVEATASPVPAEDQPPLVATQDPAILVVPAATPAPVDDPAARQELIDRMIALAEELYHKARGRAQPANSAGDIYVCKNFTVHLFRKNRDDFRMAAYPDVPLVIPNNLPAKESKPYSYGIAWEDIAPEQGNPFYTAHSFYYNTELSREENWQKALAFMRQVRRGDFFQMSAQYYYGVGAHSLVFIQDYDQATDSVTWTDSNMKGETRGGVRYGYVQFGAVKPIEWFVDAFCKKGRGATLYRLRDDIIRR
ncbi:MAG: hypothetical protein GX650_01620 [Clostridiales bacterium]|nr:hypothetical protein [Clostridiales bacterium]